MNPGDAEAERNLKKQRKLMQYLVTRRSEQNMISMVMRHLIQMPAAVALVASAALILLIWEIFSEIFSEICSVVEADREIQTDL